MPTLEESRAARAAKREANRARWEQSEHNANVRHTKARAAVRVDLPKTGADALDRLKLIMADPEVPLSRRLRAASTVLKFELPAGALSGGNEPPEIGCAYRFFSAIAAAPEVSAEHRQVALEHLAEIENARAQRTDLEAEAARHELLIAMINSERRLALSAAGNWPVPRGVRWWLSDGDVFDATATARPSPTVSMGELLNRALSLSKAERKRQADARHRQLLAITATNRDDVSWRHLITVQPERQTG